MDADVQQHTLRDRIAELECPPAARQKPGFRTVKSRGDLVKVPGLPPALALYTIYDDIYLRWRGLPARHHAGIAFRTNHHLVPDQRRAPVDQLSPKTRAKIVSTCLVW
ncbi:hypothetical protein [Salipiger aestuarii]|uniref:hypothetical protein n=1 Tax=Salipiger aestuarii TaxID=568098 RepID=UPI001238FE4B|nr:hypothetical protein [Salipiger aestuarii]KAA8614237.1 hypothetical protein AL037_03370 [Salipiger aestuarii]